MNSSSDDSVTHERVYVGVSDSTNTELHLERYRFAAGRIADTDLVLDAASGSGYGSQVLAKSAGRVIGLEVSPDAIGYAERHHQEANITYVRGDLNVDLPFSTSHFDVVVSLETLEHVARQEALLFEFARVLKPTGTLILSTPDRRMYSEISHYRNEFHTHEFSKDELLTLLDEWFEVTEIHGQVRYRTSTMREIAFVVTRMDVLRVRRALVRTMGWARRLQDHLRRFRVETTASNLEPVGATAASAHLFLLVVAKPRINSEKGSSRSSPLATPLPHEAGASTP